MIIVLQKVNISFASVSWQVKYIHLKLYMYDYYYNIVYGYTLLISQWKINTIFP